MAEVPEEHIQYTTNLPAGLTSLYHPGVIQIVPHHNIGSGRDAVVVTNWSAFGTPLTVGQLQAIQGVFNPLWLALWGTVAASSLQYLGATITDYSSSTGLGVNNAGYTPTAPTGNGTPLGDQVCVLVSNKALTRYKGGHSRWYIPAPGIGASNSDGMHVSPTKMTAINTALQNLINGMAAVPGTNGGPLAPIIWHKKLSGDPNSIENILTLLPNSLMATQRRRLRKVSRH